MNSLCRILKPVWVGSVDFCGILCKIAIVCMFLSGFKFFCVSIILSAGRFTPMAHCSALLILLSQERKGNGTEMFNIPQNTLF